MLGAVAEVPENYCNVKVILDQLNIEALEYTMSADIKMRKFLILKFYCTSHLCSYDPCW